MLARTNDDALDMHHHAGSTSGEIRAGHGRAFAADSQGKMRMFIEWQWLTGDHSAGHSEWAGCEPAQARVDGPVPIHFNVKLTVTVMPAPRRRSAASLITHCRTASSAADRAAGST